MPQVVLEHEVRLCMRPFPFSFSFFLWRTELAFNFSSDHQQSAIVRQVRWCKCHLPPNGVTVKKEKNIKGFKGILMRSIGQSLTTTVTSNTPSKRKEDK